MAQETTTSSPVENTQDDTVFTQILQRLKECERKAAQDAVVIQRLWEEQSKRKAEKEKEEKQKQDQKNVVKKLPTVLTTNERKRYSEIGKRFLLGAEQQFRQIQKGIKTKQMMKTSKDFFLKGFEKIKEQKEKTKKKSFWKILLGSLVVIGAAAFLFRDKIMKMMPNVTEQAGGLFKTIISYIGNMIKGCWNYIVEIIGGSMSGIFTRMFSSTIPNILQILFFETLPTAIFNTYLAIMSQFDPRANDLIKAGQLDSEVEADMDSFTKDGGQGDAAYEGNKGKSIDQLSIISSLDDVYNQYLKTKEATQQQLSLMNQYAARLLLYGDVQNTVVKSQRDNFIELVADAMNLTTDEVKLMVQRGQLDVQQLLQQFLASGRTGEDLAIALKQQLGDGKDYYSQLMDTEGNGVQVKFSDGTGVKGEKGTLLRADGFQALATDYARISSDYRVQKAGVVSNTNKPVIAAKTEVIEDRLGVMYNGKGFISMKFLQDEIANNVGKFLDSANKFLQNGDIMSAIKNRVSELVKNLNSYFRDFFVGTLDILKGVLSGVLTLYPSQQTKNTTDYKNGIQELSSGNYNALIHVDMTGNEALKLGTLLGQMVQKDTDIIESLTTTNSNFEKANKILTDLGELHGLSEAWGQTIVSLVGALAEGQKLDKGTILAQVLQNTQDIKALKPSQKSTPARRGKDVLQSEI